MLFTLSFSSFSCKDTLTCVCTQILIKNRGINKLAPKATLFSPSLRLSNLLESCHEWRSSGFLSLSLTSVWSHHCCRSSWKRCAVLVFSVHKGCRRRRERRWWLQCWLCSLWGAFLHQTLGCPLAVWVLHRAGRRQCGWNETCWIDCLPLSR